MFHQLLMNFPGDLSICLQNGISSPKPTVFTFKQRHMGGGCISDRIRFFRAISGVTTSRIASVSSLLFQMSILRLSSSQQAGIKRSVSRTGRPKSKTMNRRAPECIRSITITYDYSMMKIRYIDFSAITSQQLAQQFLVVVKHYTHSHAFITALQAFITKGAKFKSSYQIVKQTHEIITTCWGGGTRS